MNLLEIEKSAEEINMLSPLVWAYVGDSVYELYIRTKLVNESKQKPNKLHQQAVGYVKATAQAKKLKEIEELLTEEEQDIVRRTRNTRKSSLA